MNDGPFARMLVELDAELAAQQNIDAACDLIADPGRALDGLGAHRERNAQPPAMDAPAH